MPTRTFNPTPEFCFETDQKADAIAVSNQFQWAAAGDGESGVSVFNKSGTIRYKIPPRPGCWEEAAFVSAKPILVCNQDRDLTVLDCESGRVKVATDTHTYRITRIVGLDENHFITAAGEGWDIAGYTDASVWRHDLTRVANVRLENCGLVMKAVTQDGYCYFACSSGDVVQVDFAANHVERLARFESKVHSICIEPESGQLLVGELNGLLSLLDMRTRAVEPITFLNGPIRCLAAHNRRTIVASTLSECFGIDLDRDKLFSSEFPEETIRNSISPDRRFLCFAFSKSCQIYNFFDLYDWLVHA